MRGLKQSLLYLGLVTLVAGTIWLFWGKAIVKQYEQFKAKAPTVAKAEKKAVAAKEDLSRRAKPATATAAAEWQKAQSGMGGLIALQTDENRRDFQSLAARYETRMIHVLKQMKLYKEAPAAKPAEPQPSKRPAKR